MKSFLIAPFCFLIVGCASTLVEESNINETLSIDNVADTESGTAVLDRKTSEPELPDQMNVVSSLDAAHLDTVDNEGTYLPKYLTDYRYLEYPNNTPTEVPVWITRDNSQRFHVPWHIGGSWFDDASEKIIVDPVNKTVSVGFEQVISAGVSCSEDQKVADRSAHGYFVCNSLFAEFKLIESKGVEPEKSSLEGDSNNTESPSLWQKISGLFGADSSVENNVLVADPLVIVENSKSEIEVAEKVSMYDVDINLEQLALAVMQLNLLSKAERKLSGEAEPLDKLELRLMGKLSATKRYYEKSLQNIQRKRINEYLLSAETLGIKFKQQTFDKSGYYNYDINWPAVVSLAPSKIEAKAFSYANFVQEFKKYEINDASEALARLTLSKMKKQYRKDRSEVLRYLNESTRQYRVNCNFPRVIGDYRVAVKCPEFVTASKESVSVSLVYEVLAKRFDKVVPRYTNHNNDLTIVADSETLSLINNSDGDLKINGIEWLANDAAQLITRHTDKAKVFSIAQGQSLKISLEDSIGDDLKKELKVPYLSRRKALRKHLDYGFDVSYQVLEEGKAQSGESSRLNQTNRYSLNELLLSR